MLTKKLLIPSEQYNEKYFFFFTKLFKSTVYHYPRTMLKLNQLLKCCHVVIKLCYRCKMYVLKLLLYNLCFEDMYMSWTMWQLFLTHIFFMFLYLYYIAVYSEFINMYIQCLDVDIQLGFKTMNPKTFLKMH